MKKVLKNKLLFAAIFAAAAGFTACDDDNGEGPITDSNDIVLEDGETLPSSVTDGQTLTLSEGYSFDLNAALRIEEGGMLVIEPGVTITATAGSGTSKFIVIEQGAKIMAEGTADAPIVMTSADQNPGGWGGLLIMGRAPINVGGSATAEIGDAQYGGTDAADNSGVLKYLRTEYTGARINNEREHNGITFYGVGNGTVVDYIEAYKGADDGIEFFGGTVNVSHVVSYANQDDLFDYAQGWTGTASYLYLVQMEVGGETLYPQDKGIEGDNLENNNLATPYSNPTIQNVTLISYNTNQNETPETTDALRIREGSRGTFNNIVIQGWSDDGIDVRSLETINNINSGNLTFANIFVQGLADKATDAKIDDGETDDNGEAATAAKATLGQAIVPTSQGGADFESWNGAWVRLD